MSKVSKLGMFAITTAALCVASAVHAEQPDSAGHNKERVLVEFKPGTQRLIADYVMANDASKPEPTPPPTDTKKKEKPREPWPPKFIVLGLPERNMMALEVSANAIQGLRNNPNVISVEPDEKRYLYSTQYEPSTPYGISQVQADLLSDGAAGSRTLCIIDSGYDLGHPDLPQTNVSGSFDAGTGNWYTDENGHGTHVAGTIAALTNGEGVVGVLPNGQINLHIVKVFAESGWAYSSSLIAATDECVTAGAQVINMSLGGSRASKAEERAFANLANAGVLSVAAAGNDGNTRHSYPASYASVVSVAAVDANEQIASFSQQTDQVELAAPGVGVLSSVPRGTGEKVELTVANTQYTATSIDGALPIIATGALAACGIADAACTNVANQVCLIERGVVSFAEKVQACEAGGGVGAVIYNNEPGELLATLGDYAASIPAVGISAADGATLLTQLGSSTSVGSATSDWAFFDGTSMASPHVAGVAALVWSYHTTCSNQDIRTALTNTAKDLGTSGKDNAYGYGLVQAKAAVDYLDSYGCSGNGGDNTGGGDTGGEDGSNPGRGKGNGKGGKK
ncbi:MULTISPECIES: S8 family serine peptidase [Pseudidiomarina]|uniref:PA domain-containing protein n=2 Tax=Pseudidiomarina TaxID=2800384 RepID=A0A317PW14_9GAMM|nr:MULTISPECIES: S8 family serine peptidase [Pseudidiomarina]PWW06868.1 PA domain-containing protein [Pseudidiomarina maritima]RBP86674.1 PA domain-containing protein [Pseudidiomarina tainanensis]